MKAPTIPADVQGELAGAQEALKAARSESARRLRELQALHSGGYGAQAPGGAAAAAAALAAETAAREAAEAKLREVKAAHARKKQLVTDLRKRVRSLDTAQDKYHSIAEFPILLCLFAICKPRRSGDQQCTKSIFSVVSSTCMRVLCTRAARC